MSNVDRTLSLLLYDSRSGSTLVSALLNRYAGVCVSHETGFITRVLEYRGRMVEAADINPLLDYLYAEVQFQELQIDRNDLCVALRAQHSLDPVTVIRIIVDEYFGQRDVHARHRIIKHAPYAYLHFVRSAFPDIRFIHLVRDGRAVFSSKRKSRTIRGDPFQRNPLTASLDWTAKLAAAGAVRDVMVELRYEDVVATPDAALTPVLDFLGLDRAERVICKSQAEYFEGIGDRQQHLHQNVACRPNVQISHGWQRELPQNDCLVFEFVAGAWLKHYGYQLTTRRVPLQALPLLVVHGLRLVTTKARNAVRQLRRGVSWSVLVRRQVFRWRLALRPGRE